MQREPDMCPQQSDLNPVDYVIWDHTGANLSRQEVKACDRAGGLRYDTALLITTSVNKDEICSVS